MSRVFVIDDHPIVRAGIVGLLETEDGITVAGEFASAEEALAQVAELRPDVVLMDLRMPGLGGVAATRRIARGEFPGAADRVARPRVLVFTTYEDDDQILTAIEAGASGYLVKAAPAAELIAGVRAVAAGQTVLAPSIAAQLVARVREPVAAPRLTPRETEILGLVAQGLSNPAIAARLVIGESTVKTHLLHAFEKLEVSDRTHAVTRAMERGILPGTSH
ncbi:response regulator [Leucobacter chromiireducens]|uniref:DNA-binding response regulator n=1 Tax=Leucobacter chromiireducens subsp. solipictus TaxID=398235 RepID=A0ABS1SD05_9MICO|nr:response regulator transcription factor [Leucobacter chromiireducens]MBL3678433.1 DNA-binding response regulator [Leucobacter chromiireducens subsp. solipictus]